MMFSFEHSKNFYQKKYLTDLRITRFQNVTLNRPYFVQEGQSFIRIAVVLEEMVGCCLNIV